MGDRAAAITQFNQAIQTRGQGGDLSYQLQTSAPMCDGTGGMFWHELGNVVGDAGHSPAAVAAHRLALECGTGTKPGDMDQAARVKSLVNLGHRLHVLGRNDEGIGYIRQAIALDPKSPQAWCCLSLAQSVNGDHDQAVESAITALSLDPHNATIETALGLNLLFRGDLKRGLKHFEARYRYKLKNFLSFPYPQWQGELGKRVFLTADQGLGDTLSFARFVSAFAKRVKFGVIGVQKPLVRLFQAAFQRIGNIDIQPLPGPFPAADSWTTFVSLPTALDLSDGEIRDTPGIDVAQFQVPMSWKDPDAKFHIGVAWKGSAANEINHWRSFDLHHLLRLYEIPGIRLYSLQADENAKDVHTTGCAALIRDISPFIGDVADTTAIIRNLDLVVTVESALGHIAGAVGAPTIIPYSHLGNDYRLGRNGENIIWYPKHSIVKQKPNEPWGDTFTRVVDEVRSRVE